MPQLPPAYPINSKTSGIAPKIGNPSSVAPRIGGNPGVSAPKFSPPGSSFPGALPTNRSASLPSIPQNRSISPKYPPVYQRSSVQQTSEPDFPSTTIVQEYNDYIDDDMDDDDDTKTEQFELDQLEIDASRTTESDPIEFEEITNCELPAYEEKTNCEIPAFVFEDDADDNISFNEINERTNSDLPAYGDKTNVELNAQTTQLPVGALVNGRYAILGVIGSGGFATVYLARDITNNRNIALKAMDFQKSDDPNYSERLFREAKIAAKIKHPNVVSIFDFGHIKGNGQPFIAMELLKGHTLSKELIESGPLSPRRAFRLFSPVLDALAVGHRLGIVHKDLKPENLYIVDPGGPNEFMKILDFGVARIQSEAARLTSDGLRFGTPKYLAPEYIRSQLVSPAIDVYQMALIITEALTGVPAVSGEPYQVMMLHCNGELRIADFLLEGEVGAVFKKAFAKNPEDRYSNCEEFGLALDNVSNYFISDVPLHNAFKNSDLKHIQQVAQPAASYKPAAQLPANQPTRYPTDLSANNFRNSSNKHRSKLPVIFGILLIICIITVLFVYISKRNDSESKQIAEIQVQAPPEIIQKPEIPISFAFRTNPPGARVMSNDSHQICPSTPCDAEFNPSELNPPLQISFELEGYNKAFYELKESSFDETNGVIDLPLKINDNVDLKLVYEPAKAKVTDVELKTVVCESSPCTYHYDTTRGYVDLKFEAKGYQAKTETITPVHYGKNNATVNISLRPSTNTRKGTQKGKSNKKR